MTSLFWLDLTWDLKWYRTASELLPPGWNHSTDVYELNYRHRDNNAEYVMKILVDLDALIVNMLRTADNLYNDLTLEYAKEIRDCTTTFPEVYTDLPALNAAALQLTSLLARKKTLSSSLSSSVQELLHTEQKRRRWRHLHIHLSQFSRKLHFTGRASHEQQQRQQQ